MLFIGMLEICFKKFSVYSWHNYLLVSDWKAPQCAYVSAHILGLIMDFTRKTSISQALMKTEVTTEDRKQHQFSRRLYGRNKEMLKG